MVKKNITFLTIHNYISSTDRIFSRDKYIISGNTPIAVIREGI